MIPGFVWRVPARVARVIDGDTIVLHQLDLGFWHSHAALENQEEHIRLLDLWCAERYTDAGKAATAYAQQLLPIDSVVIFHSVVWKRTLERTLGSIELLDGRDYATEMIAAGYGTASKS
jgi:endonuclease YncB( thermonuclease family)